MFTEHFNKYVSFGDTISCTVDGFDVVAKIVFDESADAPWLAEDGHGPVSDWTSREKGPGERTLCEDGAHSLYYDVKESTALARKDGWDAPPYGKGTAGERAKRAVEADFQSMRGWCQNDWSYCGVVLSVRRSDVELDKHAASLWGIDVNHPHGDHKYLQTVANELLPEALDAGRKVLERLTANA